MSVTRLQQLRESVADLGPLRWVVAASAVVPTTGLMILLANLPALAARWPVDAGGAALAITALAVATGALLLPPSISALAAGYVFGPLVGAAIAIAAAAVGAVFGQRVVWPLVGASLIAFMQGRPRLEAVRTACARPMPAQVLRVAVVRGAARVPFSVVNLLLCAASVGTGAVFAGTLLWATPLAWLLSGLGAAWRAWREHEVTPSPIAFASLLLAASAAASFAIAARRAFVRLTTR